MEDGVTNSNPKVTLESSRRSERKKTQKRSYSPEHDSKRNYKRQKQGQLPRERTSVRPFDRLADGTPFCCDLCKSPYVCKPNRQQRSTTKRSRHQPSPRVKTDPLTEKKLTLCNACGLAFDRPVKVKTESPQGPSPGEREKYAEEARQFAFSLVEVLNDADAERLCCPEVKKRPCGCIQKYIVGDGKPEESRQRAQALLQLLKEAKRLSTQKVYSMEEFLKTKKRPSIGLGNGQKHSKEFGEYILTTRQILRDEYKLCERGCQRVLLYSNNFLHKKLKTEDFNCRVDQVRSKTATGRLKSIIGMHREKCCANLCCLIALTHANLLETWRERASSGQAETRRVLAEMLTPSGGLRANCYKFIQWITAAGYSTIASVDRQMKTTGGDREPPEHGLRKYHRDMQKQQAQQESEQRNDTTDRRESNTDERMVHSRREISGNEDRQHSLPAAQETTVLSATESVVVEQVNLLPGQDVSHLVVDSSTGHLVEVNGTNSAQHAFVPYVQQIVPNEVNWNRQQVHTEQEIRYEAPREKIANNYDPSKFKTVTRLLNTKPPMQLHGTSEDSESVLQIDLAPQDSSQPVESYVKYSHSTSEDGGVANGNCTENTDVNSSAPFSVHSRDYPGAHGTNISEHMISTPGNSGRSRSLQIQGAVEASGCLSSEQQEENRPQAPDKAILDTKSELEVQRKQIELLQKQVAEQQVQLQQQQQLLQSQFLNNMLLNQSKQNSSNIQIPGLPAGLAPTLPQLHNLISGLPISALPSCTETQEANENSTHKEATHENDKYPSTATVASDNGNSAVPVSSTNIATSPSQLTPYMMLAPVHGKTVSPTSMPSLHLQMDRQPLTPGHTLPSGQPVAGSIQGANFVRSLSQGPSSSQGRTQEGLPAQNLVPRQPLRERLIKPPPPYEVAASTSRQGSIERITPEQCAPNSVPVSSASEIAFPHRAGKLSGMEHSSAVRTEILTPQSVRRGRKPKHKPLKSPPKVAESELPQGVHSYTVEVQHDGSSSQQKVPNVVHQLLQAAGEGPVTTLTLSSEQAQDIFGQLSTCGGTDTVPSNVTISFVQPDGLVEQGSDDRTTRNIDSHHIEVSSNLAHSAPTSEICAIETKPAKPVAIATTTSSVSKTNNSGQLTKSDGIQSSESIGSYQDVCHSGKTAPNYLSPDIMQLLTQTNVPITKS